MRTPMEIHNERRSEILRVLKGAGRLTPVEIAYRLNDDPAGIRAALAAMYVKNEVDRQPTKPGASTFEWSTE